jgi:hypothetical protein
VSKPDAAPETFSDGVLPEMLSMSPLYGERRSGAPRWPKVDAIAWPTNEKRDSKEKAID